MATAIRDNRPTVHIPALLEVILVVVLAAALARIALEAGALLLTGLLCAGLLAVSLGSIGRGIDHGLRPAATSLCAVYAVHESGLVVATIAVPGFAPTSVAPAVIALLVIGAGWLLSRSHDSNAVLFDLALCSASLLLVMLSLWSIFLLGAHGLVDRLGSTADGARWLLLLVFAGGVHALARDDRRGRRVTLYVLLVLLVAVLRGNYG